MENEFRDFCLTFVNFPGQKDYSTHFQTEIIGVELKLLTALVVKSFKAFLVSPKRFLFA